MQVFTGPLFIASCLLFTVHQIFQKGFGMLIPLADAYLDNLLVMPILLTIWLAEKRWFYKAGSAYQLTRLEIIMATIYVLLVTEWLFPLLSNRFTFDAWDIAITAAGSFIYYCSTWLANLQSPAQNAGKEKQRFL